MAGFARSCASLLAVPLLVVGCLGGCLTGCKGAPPAPQKPVAESTDLASFYPLAVGNAWTYRVEGQGASREDTVRIVGRDGPWFLDDHQGRLRIDATGLRDAGRYLLHQPVRTGATWTAVESLVVQKFEITDANATASTPAGDFQHCAVVHNEQPLPRGTGKFVTDWTYAPGVGLVELRTRTEGTGAADGDQVRLRLLSYALR